MSCPAKILYDALIMQSTWFLMKLRNSAVDRCASGTLETLRAFLKKREDVM